MPPSPRYSRSRAADANQFFALGGIAGRRIADLREVKPFARQRAQLLEVGVAAIEMQRVDDDAGVGRSAPSLHDVDRFVERADARPGHELEVDGQAERLRERRTAREKNSRM